MIKYLNWQYGIRAAVAMSIALIVVRYFGFEYGCWVLLTTGFVLLGSVGQTVKRAIERIGGHLLGYVFTLIMYWAFWQFWPMPSVWLPLLIFLTTLFLPYRYFWFSFFLMPLIVFAFYIHYGLNFPKHESIYFFTYRRLYDTILGCIIATLSTLLIYPNSSEKQLQEQFKNEIVDIQKMLTHLFSSEAKSLKNIDEITQDHELKKGFIKEIAFEQALKPEKIKHYKLMSKGLFSIRLILASLSHFARNKKPTPSYQRWIEHNIESLNAKLFRLKTGEAIKVEPFETLDELYADLFEARDKKTISYDDFSQVIVVSSFLTELNEKIDSLLKQASAII